MHRGHFPVPRPTQSHSNKTQDDERHFASLNASDPSLLHRSVSSHHSYKDRPGYRRPDRGSHVGAEPGVNPRSGAAIAEYSHFKEECVIDVIDYDDQDVTFRRMGNAQFVQLVSEQNKVHSEVGKGLESDGPPLSVRWINIGGIDWNVLSSVALRYNLDSLALEDILHERGHNHSKADYYPHHLFLRILCHSLESPEVQGENAIPEQQPEPEYSSGATAQNDGYNAAEAGAANGSQDALSHPHSTHSAVSPLVHFPSKDEPSSSHSSTLSGDDPKRFANLKYAIRKRWSALSGYHSPARREQLIGLKELKKDRRVEIRKEPIFIFLLRNGTVISIHPNPYLNYHAPIMKRLRQPDSVLRTSDDPSLLVESLIDLVVDRILEVMDEYQMKISDLEHALLMEPSMNDVKYLHILSGDLIMHKRTLDPIKTMIFGLRRYDLDRCIALHDNLAMAKKEQQVKEEKRDQAKNRKKKNKHQHEKSNTSTLNGLENHVAPVISSQDHLDQYSLSRSDDQHLRAMAGQPPAVEGWFSYKSKVYLADVYDHMDFALSSLDMFAAITENLINYAFNTASYEMNIVMNRLTIVTIIFLPLTLLTGYFGMNFQPFWSVEHNSDFLFWKIAIPVMALLIPIFMMSDIKQKYRSYERRKQNKLMIEELRKEPTALDSGLGLLPP